MYRLVDYQMPLALETFMPQERYWFPCESSLYKSMASCFQKDFLCPNSKITGPKRYCMPIDFKMFKKRDTPFDFVRTSHTVPGTGHAIYLVGYNRRLEIHSALNFSKQPLQVGGFILRNSWGFRAHTLEYLAGNITSDQDAVLCPNADDTMRWIPASLSCLKKIDYNPDLLSQCSTDAAIVRGDKVIRHADLLVCHNETVKHCRVGDRYVLLRENEEGSPTAAIDWSEYGVPMGRAYNLDQHRIETFEDLPIQHLYFALKLVDQPRKNSKQCGFFFLPFETLEDLQRSSTGLTGPRWSARGLNVEFESSSFVGNSPSYNYSWIKNSIITKKVIQPKNLIDLNL